MLRTNQKTIKNKKIKSLQLKIMCPVLLAITVTFLLLLFISIIYYKGTYEQRELTNQKKQMDKIVYSISTIQSTIENISKQIVVSDVVQRASTGDNSISNGEFLKKDSVQNALSIYPFVMDYIQEITIYTKTGKTYSSSLFLDDFKPEEETWYLDFKEKGEQKGYTKVHNLTVSQSGRSEDVISYVLTYYSIKNFNEELGDLIISLDYEAIDRIATLDTSLLEGYAIYDNQGDSICYEGNIELSYEEISQIDKEEYKDENGNIWIVSRELESDWLMVIGISGSVLQRQILIVGMLILGAFLLLAALIMFALSKNIHRVVEPINRLSYAAEEFGKGKEDVSVEVNTGDEVEVLARTFNKMINDVKHYTEMSLEHEKMIRRSQVDQLLLQINPHFIYNTLNSIVYMAKIAGNQNIIEFVNAFISLLQSTLRVENKVYISLEEEISNVKNYIILQKYRYRDKFIDKIVCPEELKTYQVPKVILQPIVENAIFHGIAPMNGIGQLNVIASKKEGKLCILVEDNGVGMTSQVLDELYHHEYVGGTGMRKIGMGNVMKRIKEICGEEYGISIESKVEKGTKIVITLPLKEEK